MCYINIELYTVEKHSVAIQYRCVGNWRL